MTEASVIYTSSRAPKMASIIKQRGTGMDHYDTMSSSTTMDSSETSTSPPRTPTSAASGPSHHSIRLHSSHSSSKLFAPMSPPPNAPLPAIPQPHLIPFKPKLLPKRGLSRSPSPIVRTEQRQTYETKAIRDEIARSRRERARPVIPEEVLEQHGIAFSDDEEEGSAASTLPETILNISTSPVDDTTVMNIVPRKTSIHRIYEPPSPISAFNSMDGPLLLSETNRNSRSSNNMRNAERKSIMRADSDLEHEERFLEQNPSKFRDVSIEMAHSYSESGQKRLMNKKGTRPKTAPQKNTYSNSDVIMRELGSSADEDDSDERDYASIMQPRASIAKQYASPKGMKERQSVRAHDSDNYDDDNQRHHQIRRVESPEEIFEVAALRRQVEQLQMALKKQMGTKEKTLKPPLSRSNTNGSDRIPFNMPIPEQSSRGSSSNGVGAYKASPSSSRSFREQHSTPSFATKHGGSDYTSPSMVSSSAATTISSDRRGAPLRSNKKQHSTDHYSVYSREDQSRRMSDTMSSIMMDESASTLVREEDSKLEELSRKIQALEAMFKVSNLSPQANLSQMSFADSSKTQRQPQQSQTNSINDDPSTRSIRQRKASLATISTFEGDSMSGRRSPAASAYNFNATTPYAQSSIIMNRQHSSTSTVDVGGRKGVARFIMGVGTSKGNIPRDEFGNLLPSTQVSWSRKRNEKIAKPQIKAKMTVGPGRGRIVLQAKAV